ENNGKCKNYSGSNQPKNKSDCLKKSGKWTPNKHKTWNGCVTDRDQDYDTKNTAPVPGNPATLFPAEQYGTCPVPLMALSYDWNALNKKIDAMWNYALHDPGQYHRRRNFDVAEGLRQFAGQVLHSDVRERHHHGLQSNRDRTVQSPGRQIKNAPRGRADMKPGGGRRAY
ncbi:MAG: hypothetical protein AB7S93_08190, partial [Xanthobacteraceae bacterium]